MNSIEWFIEMWDKNQRLLSPKQIIDKAKEMHRKEIIVAFEMGRFNIDDMGCGEEYYDETYKK